MKTALLHYWLTGIRGGEKVLSALGGMLSDADIFTHAYQPWRFGEASGARLWGHRVTESFIARLPAGRRHPQAYLPLLPAASRALKLEGYDVIVSSESGPIKGIRKPSCARHLCYCHTPMRYLWDMHDDYYRAAGPCGRLAMALFTGYLRREDLKSAEAVDRFVANSAFVAERIKRLYGREAVVVHPPVDVAFYRMADDKEALPAFADRPYYLYAGELVVYKRPDLALAACRRMNRRLVVAGGGVMRDRLARLAGAGADIVFLDRVSNETLRQAYAHARALIFPGAEDFGMVPVEAQASGTPVIAFGKGGVRETVLPEKTGLFFPEQTVDALCAAIEAFEGRTWDKSVCQAQAERFSRDRFESGMRAVFKEMGVT